MSVYRPCVIRAALVSATTAFVLFAVVQILGPALVTMTADGAAGVVAAVGVVVRVLVGRAVSLETWRLGANAGSVLTSVALGGLAGWAVFPGAVSMLGLAVTGAGPSAWLSLIGSLALWLACLLAGAALGRRGAWRTSGRAGLSGAVTAVRR